VPRGAAHTSEVPMPSVSAIYRAGEVRGNRQELGRFLPLAGPPIDELFS